MPLTLACADSLGAALLNGGSVSVTEANLKLVLYTGNPASGGVECSGGGYARQSIAFRKVSDGVYCNDGAVTFPQPTAGYTAAWFGLAATGFLSGAVFLTGALSVPESVVADGDPIQFADGALVIRIPGV